MNDIKLQDGGTPSLLDDIAIKAMPEAIRFALERSPLTEQRLLAAVVASLSYDIAVAMIKRGDEYRPQQ